MFRFFRNYHNKLIFCNFQTNPTKTKTSKTTKCPESKQSENLRKSFKINKRINQSENSEKNIKKTTTKMQKRIKIQKQLKKTKKNKLQ